MQIEDIEAMLSDFNQDMIDTFKTNQEDFKALTQLADLDKSKS